MGASLGELQLSKDEQEEGRRTQMTDMSNNKRNKSSRKGKSDSEEKKNNSVSVVVSVVGAQMDDMTPTELKCPPTIEKTKTLKNSNDQMTKAGEILCTLFTKKTSSTVEISIQKAPGGTIELSHKSKSS